MEGWKGLSWKQMSIMKGLMLERQRHADTTTKLKT